MTRKDFEAIAAALADQRPMITGAPLGWQEMDAVIVDAKIEQWTKTVEAVAKTLSDLSGYTPNGNRRFDRERFMKAVTK